MEVLDKALDLGQRLIPPHVGGDDVDQIWRWRVAMAMTVGGLVMAVSVHITWACGGFLFLGIPGFASAQEIETLKQSQQSLQITQQAIYTEVLADSIRDSEERQCFALVNGNRDAARAQEDLIRDKLIKYFRSSGERYERRSCDLVVDMSRPASTPR